MKKLIIPLMLIIAISCISAINVFTAKNVEAQANTVEIVDDNLRSLLINELSLSTDQITVNDLKQLTELETPDNDPSKKISNLSGLEHATNLTYLDLSYNKITDLTPISNLTKLEHLDISYNDGSVEGTNGITDISCLSNLTKLTYFSSIANKGIKDYSVVKNFKDLTYLNLSMCDIDNIEFLKDLTSLEKLYLVSNKISNVSPLRKLTSLKKLALGTNEIYSIDCLKDLTNLERFTVENNNLSDVTVVYNFTSLTHLDVSRNYLTDEAFEELMEKVTADSVIIMPRKEGTAPTDPNPPTNDDIINDNPTETPPTDKKGCGCSNEITADYFIALLIVGVIAIVLKKKGVNKK